MPYRKIENDTMPDRETKSRILAMKEWNGFVMLIYSIQMVMLCQIIRSIGPIIKSGFHTVYNPVEYVIVFQLIVAMLFIEVPPFFDVCFILMQRVNPPHLFDLV